MSKLGISLREMPTVSRCAKQDGHLVLPTGLIMEYVLFAAVAGLLGALFIAARSWRQKQPLPTSRRVILTGMLLAPIPFCLFGFAASFEPGRYHWVWRIGYALTALGCLASILRLYWPRRN